MSLLARATSKLRLLDQRFPADEESDFKKGLERQLVLYMVVALAVSLFCLTSMVGYVAYLELATSSQNLFGNWIRRSWFILSFAEIVADVLAIGLCAMQLRFGCVSLNWERLCLVYATIFVCAASFYNPGRWAQVFGSMPEAVLTRETLIRTNGLSDQLVQVSIVTGVCVFLPFRSCCVWINPVAAFASHMLSQALIFGSAASSTSFEDSLKIPNALSVLAIFYMVLHGQYDKERSLRERWCAGKQVLLQKDLLSKQHEAACSTIDRMCDCFVELNSKLELLTPCPKLAAMIFHTGCLRSRKLTEFLSPGYDEVLERISSIEPGSCELIPLRLKDCHGLAVPVHAYFSQYDHDGSNHFLLGLAEIQDFGGCTRMSPVSPPPEPASDTGACEARDTETFGFHVHLAFEEVIGASQNVLVTWDRSLPGDRLRDYFESNDLRRCLQNIMNSAIHTGTNFMSFKRHELIFTPTLTSTTWRLLSARSSALITELGEASIVLSVVAEEQFRNSSISSSSSSRSNRSSQSHRSLQSRNKQSNRSKRSKRSVAPTIAARTDPASNDFSDMKFYGDLRGSGGEFSDSKANGDLSDLASGSISIKLQL
eukprot:TRINITY_DN5998_c0_g1_i2.p1 TRINITY_DN5998_c0_g1~~TRINITY_DN5998_c0_g1_i2.p1  ORF type:complete len:598 (-),score=80.26 TRINITY_DN5998_c0_g1_i2:316-2109(-)